MIVDPTAEVRVPPRSRINYETGGIVWMENKHNYAHISERSHD